MEFFENRSDVMVFWHFSDSTDESILNSLEAVYLSDVYVQEKRVAVSQLAWTIDVAKVDAVLRSSTWRILRRSQICMKQERER